jgi:hypothetical protein
MIAVLIESRKVGSSSWIAVRHTKKIRLTGLCEGDLVVIRLKGPDARGEIVVKDNDSVVLIPPGYTAVQAEHIKTNGKNRISIDLV